MEFSMIRGLASPKHLAAMQLLFEFLPIFAFVVAYKVGGIYVATAVIIVAVLVQATVEWIRRRRVSPMMLISAALVLIFGGITLILKDKTFIQWKPTVLYWLFALVLFGSRIIGEKTMIERILGENIVVERAIWNRANTLFALFFAAMGVANLFVAYSYDEATWVYFKFALFGALAVFTFGVALWLTSKMPPDAEQKKEGQ
jgi:intracellular septation protein